MNVEMYLKKPTMAIPFNETPRGKPRGIRLAPPVWVKIDFLYFIGHTK